MKMKMDRIVSPENIIVDLFNHEIESLINDLYQKLTLKDYDSSNAAYILVTVDNHLNYNMTVLNEIKRQYLNNGWGNVFYTIKKESNEILFQLYFPQKNQIL